MAQNFWNCQRYFWVESLVSQALLYYKIVCCLLYGVSKTSFQYCCSWKWFSLQDMWKHAYWGMNKSALKGLDVTIRILIVVSVTILVLKNTELIATKNNRHMIKGCIEPLVLFGYSAWWHLFAPPPCTILVSSRLHCFDLPAGAFG